MKTLKHSSPYSNRLALLHRPAKAVRAVAFAAAFAALSAPFFNPTTLTAATTYYWDPSLADTGTGSGGTGTWNTTTANWFSGTADVTWPNTTSYLSDFAGAAGTVTLGSAITTAGLVFGTTGYTLATSTFTLSVGTSGIDTSALTSGTTTINQAITLVGSQNWTAGTGHTLAIGALVTVGANALTFTDTGVSTTATGTGLTSLSAGLNAANTSAKVNFNGIVNWTAGTGVFGSSTTSSNFIGVANGSAGTFNMSGGTITSYQGTGYSFFIGSAATGAMAISAGSFTLSTNTAVFIGDGYNGASGVAATGTLTLSGTGSFSTGTTTGSFYLGNVSAAASARST